MLVLWWKMKKRHKVTRIYFLDSDNNIVYVDQVFGREMAIWPDNNRPLKKQIHEKVLVDFEYTVEDEQTN